MLGGGYKDKNTDEQKVVLSLSRSPKNDIALNLSMNKKYIRACSKQQDEENDNYIKGCVNLNIVQFDPFRKRGKKREKYVHHKQFISKVANNKSKNTALIRYKAFNPGLYRFKDGQICSDKNNPFLLKYDDELDEYGNELNDIE